MDDAAEPAASSDAGNVSDASGSSDDLRTDARGGRGNALALACAGHSAAMERLRVAAARVAPHATTVLLTGETGTGKGRLARALHEASGRCRRPFVHVDCAGLAGPLLEAELYGVARGAFTGAHDSRAGRFEAAAAGSLFLDEIAELPLSGQTKLLRALEEGTFERIGETRTRRLEARVIAATHVDLERAVAEGRFRADLYFRLRVVALWVPPLRARGPDLMDWLERAGRRAAQRLGRPVPTFEPGAIALLRLHDWPGNLRELFHLVEAAAIWSDGPIGPALVEQLLPPSEPRPSAEPAPSSTPTAPIPTRVDETDPAAGDAGGPAGDPSADRLRREVDRAGGNLSLAARRLGMPRSTLRARLGRDDAARRMRRLRLRSAGPGGAGWQAGEGREPAPDQAQGDQRERDPVEPREEDVIDPVEQARAERGPEDGTDRHADQQRQRVEKGEAGDPEDEDLGE
ncbi:MAG TPA: sigma-54 dependent transcriptional regulator, partial [Myxococcota bacterium]|nr:sigma-54 dependent transcriptional regulator [Myxococcota bacterium]